MGHTDILSSTRSARRLGTGPHNRREDRADDAHELHYLIN